MRSVIRRTKTLTDRPFGVGVILLFPHEENIKAILDEGVAVLQVSWGDCTRELVEQAHAAGAKIIPQIGSIEGAQQAIDAGVDAIIVQGYEAGGHILGQEGLMSLLPRVVKIVGDRDIPVLAAGGIVDGRGYAAALALGAQGVCLGSRFLTTVESYAHPTYKQKLVEYHETTYTGLFGRARWPGGPHRVLKTPFYENWKTLPAEVTEVRQPIIGQSTINGVDKNIRRFEGTVPNATTTGSLESMVMYGGQTIGLINEILTAAEVIEMVVGGARRLSPEDLD